MQQHVPSLGSPFNQTIDPLLFLGAACASSSSGSQCFSGQNSCLVVACACALTASEQWLNLDSCVMPPACCAGFDVADAIALLRLDDLYVEVFEVKDVKVRPSKASLMCCCKPLHGCCMYEPASSCLHARMVQQHYVSNCIMHDFLLCIHLNTCKNRKHRSLKETVALVSIWLLTCDLVG